MKFVAPTEERVLLARVVPREAGGWLMVRPDGVEIAWCRGFDVARAGHDVAAALFEIGDDAAPAGRRMLQAETGKTAQRRANVATALLREVSMEHELVSSPVGVLAAVVAGIDVLFLES